jgi:hypothetical protein
LPVVSGSVGEICRLNAHICDMRVADLSPRPIHQHPTKRQATTQLVLESHQRETTEHGVAYRPRLLCGAHI